MADYISERTAGQIISDSIRLYGKNLPIFFTIYVLPILPVIAIEAAATALEDDGIYIITTVVESVIATFALGAMTFAVSDICLGNRPSVKRSYGALFRVFWSYLGTYFIYTLATLVGFVLVLVPGFIAMTLLVFSLPASIIERRGPIEACKRSIQLGKGYYWRIFGILLLALLLTFVIMYGFLQFSFQITILIIDPGPAAFFLYFALGVLSAAAAPLFQIPAILLYYDMRARKEHFDGAALAQELMT